MPRRNDRRFPLWAGARARRRWRRLLHFRAIVIVVSITGITNFVVPVYSFGMSQRLLRFSFLLCGGLMGLFGILCGILLLIAHLVSLKSFGVPYMAPVSPSKGANWKDVLVRTPRPWLNPDGLPRMIRELRKKS